MRVVLDTVVLVRGLIAPFSWWGRLVFDHSGGFHWVVSPSIVAEYLDVLNRPELTRKYRTAGTRDLRAVLDQIGTAIVIQPENTPAICRDPDDDKFLAAALAGNARFVVSEDKDLLDLGSFEDIRIVDAETFLQVLRLSSNGRN